MKKLLIPRGYLSHTSIDTWKRSPERYIRKYMLGEDVDLDNSGLRFGKIASEALDGGEAVDMAMEALVSLLPHYRLREHEIRVPLVLGGYSVDLLGRMDTYDDATPRFREYKTGRVPWTLTKAQKAPQLRHYATLIYLDQGKIPTEAWLDWAETQENDDGDVELTGRIESFPVKIGMQEVLEYMGYTMRVAKEIDAEYKHQLKKLT